MKKTQLSEEVSQYLKSVAGNKSQSTAVKYDSEGSPIFNKFGERTELKSDSLKFYRHEEFSDITNPHFYVFSDIHAGVAESELERVARQVEMAENDKSAIVLLNGDNVDFAIPDSVGDSFSQTDTAKNLIQKIRSMFGKLDTQGKIAGNLGGNHDNDRVYKQVGHSFVDQYTKRPSLFHDGMAVHQFVLKHMSNPEKTVNLNVLIQHGQIAKGGPLGTINAGLKAAQELFSSTVHAVFLGHTHQNAFGTEVNFVMDSENRRINKNIISAFSIPSAVVTQDYALKKGYKLSETDNNVIVMEQMLDNKSKDQDQVYFHGFSYSMDALFAAGNMLRQNDIENLKQFAGVLRNRDGVYKKKLSKLVTSVKRASKENLAGINEEIRTEYGTQLSNLIELQKTIQERQEQSDIAAFGGEEPQQANINQRQDTSFVATHDNSAVNKFNTVRSKLPEGLTNIHLYVLSDLFINSDPKSRVNLRKLKKDISTIAADPKALVAINGNLFEFDDGIFGFKRGEPTKTAFLKFEANYKVIEKEFDQFKNLATDREKFKAFASMSDADKLATYKKLLETDEYKNSAFSEEFDREAKISMQKHVYQKFIDLYAKLLAPIKDKVIVVNDGSEETKIENFRDYNPLDELAVKMGVENASTDSRFWVLKAGYKNFLTDETRRTATILGTSGAKNANTPTALQNRINTVFKQFGGIDIGIISGYSRNAIYKENTFYEDQKGTLFVKPRTLISLSGYRKVLEPNKVHLKSYDAERDLNRYFVDISIHRDPAYIGQDCIDSDGKVINYNEDFFKSLQRVEVPEDLEEVYIKRAIKIPYKVSANLVPFDGQTNLYEETIENTAQSEKLKYSNQSRLVDIHMAKTTETFEQSQAKIPIKLGKEPNPLIKLYGRIENEEELCSME